MNLFTEFQMQEIVSKITAVLPYNINIMNNKGKIIASSDPGRIGQIHKIALEALQNNNQMAVYEDHDGMLKGVNTPINFLGQPIGVIGISGEVDKVSEIIQLVRITVELLITQEYLLNTKQITKQMKEQFLYEWSYRVELYDDDFISRGLALNIDLTPDRCAVVIEMLSKTISNAELEALCFHFGNQNYYIHLQRNEYAIFIKRVKSLDEKLEYATGRLANIGKAYIGIGNFEKTIHASLLQARNAIKVGRLIDPTRKWYHYKDFEFFCSIEHNANISRDAIEMIEKLVNENNAYLLDTLIAYYQYNGKVNVITDVLHIHRNSLDYRIKRIMELTGKDLRCYSDLYYLLCAYISYCTINE